MRKESRVPEKIDRMLGDEKGCLERVHPYPEEGRTRTSVGCILQAPASRHRRHGGASSRVASHAGPATHLVHALSQR